MNPSKKSFALQFSLILLITISAFSCKTLIKTNPESVVNEVIYTDTLTMAPYLYVPRLSQFIDIMQAQWTDLYPTTYLQVVTDWDCYSADPPDSIDVFVYDGIFFNHFRNQGYLQPIPSEVISNPEDILPYALDAGKVGDTYYSLPQIGCGNILFYRSGDVGIENAHSFQDLFNQIGAASYTTPRPPANLGFMMDFSGGTTNACYYAGTSMQINNLPSPPQPTCPNELQQGTIDSLQILVTIAGLPQATYGDTTSYNRGLWFGEGSGRAMWDSPNP